jgi:hypothetical protein
MSSTISKLPTTQSFIDTAIAHANSNWRKSALAAVKRLARKRETLTSADVFTALAKSDVCTHDLRAIGGVMVQARDQGYIESGGLVRRSDKHNRGATTLWRSRLCQAKDSSNQ